MEQTFFWYNPLYSSALEVKNLHDATVERFISWRLALCTQAVQIVPSECLFTSVSGVHCHVHAGHLASHFKYYVTSGSTVGLTTTVVVCTDNCAVKGLSHVEETELQK